MGEQEAGKSKRLVLTSLTISHVSQHFYAGAPILYQSLREALALSYTQIGLMTGVVNILGGFLQIIYSILGRRFSRRLLLGASNIILGTGCAITGIADRFATVMSGSAASGVGQAGQHPVSTSILTQKFERKVTGTALSIFYGLGYTGNIVSPLLLSSVAVFFGWRSAFLFLAVIPVLAGILVIITLRGEPAGEKAMTEKSERRNLAGDIRSSLRVKGAISILVVQSIVSGGTGMGVMTTWVPMFLRDPSKGLGLTVFFAGIISSAATVGGVLGTIFLGRIADRNGYLKTAMASLAITTVTISTLNLYSSFNLILVPNLFLLSMTTFSLTSLLQAHLASITSSSERDILIGLFFTIGSGVSSLWSTMLGVLIDQYSFNAVWITMAAGGVVALGFLYNAYRSIKPKQL